jgi:hypothetical protein
MDSVATRVTFAPTADWSAQYSIAHTHAPESLYPNEDQQRQTASVMFHHTLRAAQPLIATMNFDFGPSSKPKSDDMQGMDMSSDMPGMDMSPPAAKPAAKQRVMPMMHMTPEPVTDISATLVWGRTRSLGDAIPSNASRENSYLAEALLRFRTRNYAWTRMENAGRSNELLLKPGTPLPAGFSEQPLGHVAAFSFGYDRDYAVGRHLLAAPGVQFTVYKTPAALSAIYGDTPTAETLFVRFRLR